MKDIKKELIGYEIIDFHTHPFLVDESNVCFHKDFLKLDYKTTLQQMDELNVSHFCGTVIRRGNGDDNFFLRKMRKNNEEALELEKIYNGRYVAGFHVSPKFVKESCEIIEKMAKAGHNLIGELTPYNDGWEDYSDRGLCEILEVADHYNMVVNFHGIDDDNMDVMVKEHPNLTFVCAHPKEYNELLRHINRAKLNENYHLDLSGTGLFRFGMLRHLIDTIGVDKLLFGSDYPVCSLGMYVGGIIFDNTITDNEKEKILSLNAKRLLKL